MSYSFNVKAASKEAVKAEVKVSLDSVLAAQPSHAHDIEAAKASAFAAIDLLADNPDKDITVSMNGSISGKWQPDNSVTDVSGIGISVHVSHCTRS